MSTSPLGIPRSQDAPNSGAVTVAMGMPSGAEPTEYLLVPIREGADFTLYRGQQHGNSSPVLVVAPTAEHPSPESLRRLAHEYSLEAKSILNGQPSLSRSHVTKGKRSSYSKILAVSLWIGFLSEATGNRSI